VYRAEAVLFKLLGGKPKETNMKNSRGDVIKEVKAEVEMHGLLSQLKLTFPGKIPTISKEILKLKDRGFVFDETAEKLLCQLCKSHDFPITDKKMHFIVNGGRLYSTVGQIYHKSTDKKVILEKSNIPIVQSASMRSICWFPLYGGEIFKKYTCLLIRVPNDHTRFSFFRVSQYGLDMSMLPNGNTKPNPYSGHVLQLQTAQV